MEIVDVATVQNRYNVGHRDDEDVLRACERNDVGFIPWGPMYAVDEEAPADVLDAVADRHDATARQVALAWLLDHSDVTLRFRARRASTTSNRTSRPRSCR